MMETIPEHKIDRSGWPAGEWDSELDRLDFVHAGFACLLLRNRLGTWCGYAGVPELHPAFGKAYNSVDIDVHGGLTYANTCQNAICHVPQPGMPDKVWWLGFDTAHGGDVVPGMRALFGGEGIPYESYKTLAYAHRETESLAEQLAKMKNG